MRVGVINNKGFSLIELLIAIVILSIGLLSLAKLQGSAIKGNRFGNLISQATVLAEDQVELIRSTDYAQVSNTNTDFASPQNNLGAFQNFTRTTLIEENVPLNELKRITVTVSWNDGRQHKIVLSTIISDKG